MTETVYVERDNTLRRKLLLNDRELEPQEWQAVNRVSFKIGAREVNTADDPELIEHSEGVVAVRAGRLGLSPGGYQAYLTVYDHSRPNGIAWDRFTVVVADWPKGT